MSVSALSPRIEQFAPELERIVSTSERIEYLAEATAASKARLRDRCGGKKTAIYCSATSITTGA